MKALKDLKDEIIAKKFQKFYVFYGEDYGLRRHYINEISKSFKRINIIDSALSLVGSSTGSGLIKMKQIQLVYGDEEFAKQKVEVIKTFISRIKDDCIILVYEDELPNSTLFKEFSEYITYFPRVNRNIALEFIDDEVKLTKQDAEEFAKNCKNDYSLICLESDKIRNYSQNKQINEEVAFQELTSQNQLIYEQEPFSVDEFMNDILKGNFNSLAYWCNLLNNVYPDSFWIYLNAIFNNYLIAYLIVKYGKWEGSNRAYDYKLPWGRTKVIRDLIIPYEADYLLDAAFEISKLDLEVKNGRLQQQDLFNHFLCTIL